MKEMTADTKPMELPVLRLLGANASDVWRDDAGKITETSNSFAKNRIQFGYDQKNQLDTVTRSTLGKEAITFKREPDSNAWYSQVGGERVYLPGEMQVRKNGDLAIEQKDGSWKIEEPSGALRAVHTLPNNAKIDLNEDGTVSSIKRADGAEVHCLRQNGKLTSVEERDLGAREVRTWRQEGDAWKCSGKNAAPRRDMQVTPEGAVTFKTEDGLNRSVLSGGEIITTGAGRSGTTFDSKGQLSKYVYAGGQGSRLFERDGQGQINKFSECDATGAVSRTFTRDGDKSAWNVADKDGKPVGVWQGAIATDACGGWSSISLTAGTRTEDLRWTRVDEQGNQSYVRTMDGGINLTSDLKNNLTDVARANGTTATCEFKDGEPVKITTTNMPGGDGLTFTYDKAKNVWHPDNPRIADSVASPLAQDGTLNYKTTDGNAVAVNVDGTQVIAKVDGSRVDIDQQGLPSSCTANDGSTRLFQYTDKKLSGYVDTVKGKSESHQIAANDKNQYHLTDMGDLKFSDGSGGNRCVNNSNLDMVRYNGDNLPAHVQAHTGSLRDIEYVPGTNKPLSITDRRPSSKGPLESKFEWREGFDEGSMGLIQTRDSKEELKETRHDVKLDQFGNYAFTSEKGEQHLCRAGDQLVKPGQVFNSPDIDQARATFGDTMLAAFKNDEKRMERLDEMMTRFEKRMSNTIERRVAGGEEEKAVQQQVEDKVDETYRQLNRLASAPDGGTFDDKASRVNFAETFMYHAFWPQSVTQQGWNSCWNQSQWILSLGEHPQDYARMMADVSLTGKYTDRNNQAHTFNKSDLAIRQWQRWTWLEHRYSYPQRIATQSGGQQT